VEEAGIQEGTMSRYDAGVGSGRGWVDAGSLTGQSDLASPSGGSGSSGVGMPAGVRDSASGENRLGGRGVRRQRAEVDVWGSVFDRRNIIPFLTASTMVIPITLVGTFRLGEILILLLFPFYIRSMMQAMRNREVSLLMIGGILWFVSQVLSDLVNGTPSSKYIRGWGNIGLTMMNFLFYCGLYRDRYRSHIGTIIGMAFGGAFGAFYLYFFGDKSQVNPEQLWDFYVSAWAYPCFGFLAYAAFGRFPWLVIGAGLVYGIVGNIYGGRSDGLIALSSTMIFGYLWYSLLSGQKDLRYLFRNGAVLAGLLMIPFFLLYVHYAQSGVLGKTAKVQIDLAKNPYNPIEVLLLARNESVIAIDAIAEKPLLGHGSWANPMHLRKLYLLKMREIYGAKAPKTLVHDVLPVHSVLLGAWVFSGLVGFLYWVFVITRTLVLTDRILRFGSVAMVSIAVVYLPFFSWHVMFSPHSFARFVWPSAMAFLAFASADRSRFVQAGRVV
jgi:hypothetical protein